MNISIFRNLYAITSSPYELNNKKNRQIILEENKKHNFSHYFVCEYNRITIKKNSIKWNPHIITFIFMKQISTTEWEEYPFAIQNNFNGMQVRVDIEDNIIILTSLSNGKKKLFNIYTFIEFLHSFPNLNLSSYFKDTLQYKLTVRYIGQTEITEDYFRFENHEKICEISNHLLEYNPQMQILIIFDTFQIQQTLITDIKFLETKEKIKDIPKNIQKNIVEAALINYFKPKFNDKFVNSFPSNKHSSYDYFYKNALTNIAIEFRNENRAFTIGNENIPYSKSKIINFELFKNDKYDIFPKLEHNHDLDNFIKLMS
ncbi:hypothetical protein ACN2EN_07595 [Aliarcobacter lanthieri]|uniref:hypothetical protein n=1 Tax=Aliarcobacter lanthieri TaxID=1355374 RepID=UPI003AFB67D5